MKMAGRVIILAESASFPWGMAASTRVRSLAKGLIHEGWSVEYVSLRGADIDRREGGQYLAKGKLDGIEFFYPGMVAVRPGSWCLRRLDDVMGFCSTLAYLLASKKRSAVDAVIFYTSSPNYSAFFIPYLHALRIPVILEVCEWPVAVAEVRRSGYREAKFFCEKIVPMVDGVLPISSYIEEQIRKVVNKKKRCIPSFKIPILVDMAKDRTPIQPISNTNSSYMVYSGSMSYMDIAEIVVDIVAELRKQQIYIPVKFTGKKNNSILEKLKKLAETKGVLELFEFTGFVSEDKLHALMQGATCLLAPLPENLQSMSRFPTKIGYYLASGRPVVTNAIGDVSFYLQDGVNAFIAEKCTPQNFAQKIKYLLQHPDISRKVGISGRKLAFEKFHYAKACKGLGEFISQIVKNYKDKNRKN